MKTIIRPLRSWQALIDRLRAYAPILSMTDLGTIGAVAERLAQGLQPLPAQADRLERLDLEMSE